MRSSFEVTVRDQESHPSMARDKLTASDFINAPTGRVSRTMCGGSWLNATSASLMTGDRLHRFGLASPSTAAVLWLSIVSGKRRRMHSSQAVIAKQRL